MTTSKQWTITDEAGQVILLQTEVTDAQGRKQVVPATTVRGVIIASSGTLTKAWYEKAYTPGTNAAPDCFSNDGKTPAPGVAKPQCSNCAQCPKNAFGSHPTTGRGKACGDRKLVVLALDSMPDKYATFNVPTMSLQSLAKIDSQLRSNNIPLQSVMMEFNFDPAVTYPVVKIGAIGYVDKASFERFRAAADTDEISQLLREVDYEAPAETQSVVPNNTIGFGTGGQVVKEEPKEPELTPKQKAAAALKAQLAALEAEDEEPTNGQVDGQANTMGANGSSNTSANANILGEASSASNTAQSTPAPAKRKRRTQAEMEAARNASAAAASSQTSTPLEQGVASTLAPEVSQEATQPTATTGTQPNVLDLLSKWQTK
jgi:hypothetical protein